MATTFPSTISIEGNIGSGKTSLCRLLSDEFHTACILEEFEDNPFLKLFFKNHTDYAFQMEVKFLLDRFKQVKREWASRKKWVSDYAFCKSLVYAKNNISDQEYVLFQQLHEALDQQLPQPELIVYLNISPERSLKQIKQRGREFENNTPLEYLESINTRYLEYLKINYPEILCIIEVENKDFVNSQADYEWLKAQITATWNQKQNKQQ